MEEFLFPSHPFRCIICGPSSSGKRVFFKKIILNDLNECDKIYIYSTGLHQDLYQKLLNCFANYMSIPIIQIFSMKKTLI